MTTPRSKAREEAAHEQLENDIKVNRNNLYEETKKDWKSTVLLTYITGPIIRHGTHLIYAPSDVLWAMCKKMSSGQGTVCKSTMSLLKGKVQRAMKEYTTWIFAGIVALCVFLFYRNSKRLICLLQNLFMGWAEANQRMDVPLRFLSISAMMSLRLVVSNLLPFTSPAFAYLIAKSQKPGEEWQGSFFLLLCSMPPGAIVPFLDWVLSKVSQMAKTTAGLSQYDNNFLATKYLSFITDYLPFSFWVRPYFMEPAFKASKEAGASSEGAASAAVLAGHFMIWAGAPTTMYMRMFVPDWWTCIFIQPLGLMEDVAVVLATWAGQSQTDQKYAEMSLYGFMLACNLAHWYTTGYVYMGPVNVRKNTQQTKPANLYPMDKVALERIKTPLRERVYHRLTLEHCIVGGLTLLALLVRMADISPIAKRIDFPQQPSGTVSKRDGDLCPTEHTSVKAMLMTVAWVSVLAMVFKIVATVIAKKIVPVEDGEAPLNQAAGGAKQPLLH